MLKRPRRIKILAEKGFLKKLLFVEFSFKVATIFKKQTNLSQLWSMNFLTKKPLKNFHFEAYIFG